MPCNIESINTYCKTEKEEEKGLAPLSSQATSVERERERERERILCRTMLASH